VPQDSLTITDNRTGRSYDIPVSEGTVRATDLRQIKVSDDDFGLMTYDPAFMNTAACRSAITFIDGDRGILRYRGYPIEQLADQGSFLEVAYLLIEGELPTKTQLTKWTETVKYHTDMRDLQLFIQVRDRYVTNKDRYPAWTAIGASALAMPGLLAEIKCTAWLPD